MIIVKGEIVGVVKKSFKKKDSNENFQIATYFVVDANGNGGRPVEFKSFNVERKVGESVECPVYLKIWTSAGGRNGCDLMEITSKK